MTTPEPDWLGGTLPDGRKIRRYAIANDWIEVGILDFGAGLHGLRALGHPEPLTLGSPDAAAYGRIMETFGTVVGPVANRIAQASARIEGQPFRFDANQAGRHTLHSGEAGINRRTWTVTDHGPDRIRMEIALPDGDGGFPGNRQITSIYRLEGAALIHELKAVTDRTTLMNPALHGYWSMQPPGLGWTGQRLTIHADRYLPVDADILPTGDVADVSGTGFDFRTARRLDPDVTPDLDHNFCLSDGPRPLAPALRLESDVTGLAMTLETTAPGLQIFGMHPFSVEGDETLHGIPYPRRAALAIEPQHWPDAPGRDGWPSILLQPGALFHQVNRYGFERL